MVSLGRGTDVARGCLLLLLLLLDGQGVDPQASPSPLLTRPRQSIPPSTSSKLSLSPDPELVEAVRDALTHSPGKRHSSCRAEQVYASVPCQGKSPEGCLT